MPVSLRGRAAPLRRDARRRLLRARLCGRLLRRLRPRAAPAHCVRRYGHLLRRAACPGAFRPLLRRVLDLHQFAREPRQPPGDVGILKALREVGLETLEALGDLEGCRRGGSGWKSRLWKNNAEQRTAASLSPFPSFPHINVSLVL